MADSAAETALIERIAPGLVERRLTAAVAESLTGGLLAGALTARAGSSDYFLGGIVAYAERIKVEVLGLPAQIIARETAVSKAAEAGPGRRPHAPRPAGLRAPGRPAASGGPEGALPTTAAGGGGGAIRARA